MFKYIFSRDLNFEKKYEALFRRNAVTESSIWLKSIYLFISIFISAFLLLSIAGIISQGALVDFIMLGVIVFILILVELLSISQKSKKRILQEVVINIMYIFTMISMGGLAICGYVFGTAYQLFLYALGLFMASIMIIRQPFVTIIVYAIIHFLFTAMLYLATGFENISLYDHISLLLIVLVSIITSSIRYSFFKLHFKNEIKLQELNASLKNLSSTDQLTGLYNRKKTYEELLKHIEITNRYKNPMTVMIIDIDHFNEINNQYGHIIADKVLFETADILRASFRTSDIIGRWRGESFIAICINTTADLGNIIAKRALQMIDMNEFDEVFSITISIGLSEFIVGESADELIMRADTALYKAKALGHNRVETE